MTIDNAITKFLKRHYIFFNVYAIIIGFTCYFCMYGFRKPFSIAEFKGLKIFKVDYKIMAITFQTFQNFLESNSFLNCVQDVEYGL